MFLLAGLPSWLIYTLYKEARREADAKIALRERWQAAHDLRHGVGHGVSLVDHGEGGVDDDEDGDVEEEERKEPDQDQDPEKSRKEQ